MVQGQRPWSPVVEHFLVVVVSITYVIAFLLIGDDIGKHTDAISQFVRTFVQSLSADRRRGDSSEYEANEDFHLGGVVCRLGGDWEGLGKLRNDEARRRAIRTGSPCI